MTELQKLRELCEAQAREIENYARIVNEIKYILDGATLKCQYVIEPLIVYKNVKASITHS